MSPEDIAIICLTTATLIVTGLGIFWGYKWHKAALRQNLEQELARVEIEIKDIEAQQEDARTRGVAATSRTYSIDVPNPYGGVVVMLEIKKRALKERKAEIEKQLKQL